MRAAVWRSFDCTDRAPDRGRAPAAHHTHTYDEKRSAPFFTRHNHNKALTSTTLLAEDAHFPFTAFQSDGNRRVESLSVTVIGV